MGKSVREFGEGKQWRKQQNRISMKNLEELSGITLVLHLLVVIRCGVSNHGNAGVSGECGHGSAADEGGQTVFVSG